MRRQFFIAVAMLITFLGGQASALDQSQKNALGEGARYFNTEEACTVSIDSVSLLGGDNPTKIWNFLKQKGLSDIAAAGIMGNFAQESGFSPTAGGGGPAHGIGQWQDDRYTALLNFAKQQNLPWTNLGVQLDFLWKEISPGGNRAQTLVDLKKTTDVTTETVGVGSTYTFEIDFEGASDPVMSHRIRDAGDALKKYGGGSVGEGGVQEGNVEGGCAGNTGTTPYTSSDFPLYSQCDPKWGNHPYWGDDICGSGCGPTSMAMIITALTGTKVTPDVVADYFTKLGLQGSWGAAEVAAKHWGLKSKVLGTDVAKVTAAIQAGSYVIMAGQGDVPFTGAGHFVVVRGVNNKGQWILGDPDTAAGHSNTKAWDPSHIIAGVINDGAASSIVAISK